MKVPTTAILLSSWWNRYFQLHSKTIKYGVVSQKQVQTSQDFLWSVRKVIQKQGPPIIMQCVHEFETYLPWDDNVLLVAVALVIIVIIVILLTNKIKNGTTLYAAIGYHIQIL